MPLFPSPNTTRARSPVAALNRPPVSIYTREINESPYSSTAAQLGAATVDGGTALHRQRTFGTFGAADVSLVFVNYGNPGGSGETTTTVPITVSATVEYPAGTFYQVLFNGATSIAIAPGQTVVSDPIAINIPANTYFYTRTFATVPAPGQVSPSIPVGPAAIADPLGVDATNCGDNYRGHTGIPANANGSNQLTTGGQGWLSTYGSYSYGPLVVIGTPAGGNMNRPVVAIVGDSIADFTADAQDGGYLARGLIAGNVPYYRLARGNEGAVNWSGIAQRQNRMQRVAAASSVIYQYGTNDLVNTMTFAQFRSYALAGMLACGSYGATVFVVTITPRTTSTDGFVTTGNQTVVTTNTNGYNVVRQQVNAYYRAAYAAGAGNSLAFDLSAQGTLFGGIIDAAQRVETDVSGVAPSAAGALNPNADRWYATGGVGYTADGIHPSATTHTAVLQPIVPVGQFV